MTPDSLIYLDHHATTPCDPRVIEAMLPCFAEDFGNPASAQHVFGRRTAALVERARAQVATAIGCEPAEIIFTSGATEANNLALFGVIEAARQSSSERPHLITQVTEHKAVLDVCDQLEKHGVDVTYLGVGEDGRIDPTELEAALTEHTVLVSIMLANNEIGTLQPLAEIVEICQRRGVLVHSDAAQVLAHANLHLSRFDVDMMSLSAHKAYGPKGVGALYARRKRPRVRLVPRQFGGGHERGRRSGTLDVPAIVGFGVASELAGERREADAVRLAALRDRLLNGLRQAFPDLEINGGLAHRLPNNLNVSLPGVIASELLKELRTVAISSGSACTAPSATDASYVLAALSSGRDRAERALRFGIGRTNTESEIDRAVAEIVRAASRVHGREPLDPCAADPCAVYPGTVDSGAVPENWLEEVPR